MEWKVNDIAETKWGDGELRSVVVMRVNTKDSKAVVKLSDNSDDSTMWVNFADLRQLPDQEASKKSADEDEGNVDAKRSRTTEDEQTPVTATSSASTPSASATAAAATSSSTVTTAAATHEVASGSANVEARSATPQPSAQQTQAASAPVVSSSSSANSSTQPAAFGAVPLHEQQQMRSALLDKANGIQRITSDTSHIQVAPMSISQQQNCLTCREPATFLCSKCCVAWYCGRKCQIADWPKHRTSCTPAKQIPAGAQAAAQYTQGAGFPYSAQAGSQQTSANQYQYYNQYGQGQGTGAGAGANATQAQGTQAQQAQFTAPQVTRPCAICGKEATCKCSICGLQFYCSRECQVQAWPEHKPFCGPQTQQAQTATGTQAATAAQ